MLPPKCSITNTDTVSFPNPLVPSIRHMTGSKVHTAKASTFTLKRASLQLWSSAIGLQLCQGKCTDSIGERAWCLWKLKEWLSVEGKATTFEKWEYSRGKSPSVKGLNKATRVYWKNFQFSVATVYSFSWAEDPNYSNDRVLLQKKDKRPFQVNRSA